MTTSQRALLLGATGGIGGETARQLAAAGWQINALSRHTPSSAGLNPAFHWIPGDAMQREAVIAAAQDCQVIVHAVNPAGYRNWGSLVLPMIENTIAAAEATGATIVLPGTLYNYGPDAFPLIDEQAPQRPLTRKGEIRRIMEDKLRQFTARGGRVIIVRAGDFFGPGASNNWFSQGLIKPGKPVTTIANPGKENIGHQWAYLPDVARTIVELVTLRAQLNNWENIHMAGHWDCNGRQMAETICRVVEKNRARRPRITGFPWWLLQALSPFHQGFKEILEMRYLWQQPVQLANPRLLALLGEEPHIPWDIAVESTLTALGCLDAAD